jgi:hypothetical protein
MGFATRSRDEIALVGVLKPLRSSLVCGGPEAAGRAWEGVVLGGMVGKPLCPCIAGQREHPQGGFVENNGVA